MRTNRANGSCDGTGCRGKRGGLRGLLAMKMITAMLIKIIKSGKPILCIGGFLPRNYYPPPYLRVNRTVTVIGDGVGWPFKIAGRYFHFFTALIASSTSIGCPLMT